MERRKRSNKLPALSQFLQVIDGSGSELSAQQPNGSDLNILVIGQPRERTSLLFEEWAVVKLVVRKVAPFVHRFCRHGTSFL